MSGPMRALASFLRPAKAEPEPKPKPKPAAEKYSWYRAPGEKTAGEKETGRRLQSTYNRTARTARFDSDMQRSRDTARAGEREAQRVKNKADMDRWGEGVVRNVGALGDPVGNVKRAEARSEKSQRSREQARLQARKDELNAVIPKVKPKAEQGRFGGTQKPLLGVQFNRVKEISWEDYEKLDPRSQASIQANTLINEAIKKDRALADVLDTNRDGKVSVAEAGTEANGYRELVERRFGARQGWDDERIRFAPNTAAVTEFLNIEDSRGSVEDFYGKQLMSNEQELLRGALAKPQKVGRAGALSMVTSNMDGLNKALENGRVMVEGFKAPVTTAGAGGDLFSELVTNLRAGVGSGATFESLFAEGADIPRFNLTPLQDPDTALRTDVMEQLYNAMSSPEAVAEGMTEEAMTNPDFMESVFRDGGYGPEFTFSEWKKMLDRRKAAINDGIKIGAYTVAKPATQPVNYLQLNTQFDPGPTNLGALETEEEE